MLYYYIEDVGGKTPFTPNKCGLSRKNFRKDGSDICAENLTTS